MQGDAEFSHQDAPAGALVNTRLRSACWWLTSRDAAFATQPARAAYLVGDELPWQRTIPESQQQ
jgi:hypothetical protein